MDTVNVNEQENYRLLGDLVVTFATRKVQKIFFARHEALTKEPWGQRSTLGQQFFETRPAKERLLTYTNSSLEDRKKLAGDPHKWDITMLDKVLSNIDFSPQNPTLKVQHDEENRHIKAIKTVRNKYSHPTQKQITQNDFEGFWAKAKSALLALESSETEIDEIEATRVVTSFKLFHPPTKNLTWSQELLQKIQSQLLECSGKEDCLDRIVVLCGPRGIGKSDLARTYATTFSSHPIIQNVAWIEAEDVTRMERTFLSLANQLKIPTESKELREIVEKVYEHFGNYIENGLFIFQNAPQMNEKPFGIYEYLPIQESLKRRPLLLLTAQDVDWDLEDEENVINLDGLSQQDLFGS